MIIAHLSDTHIEEGARLDELVQVLDAFLAEARKASADLILHTGDVYHRKSTPAERLVAADFLRRAAEICPVVGVRGNHDAIDDVEIFNHLQGRHPIWFAQRPHTFTFRDFVVVCLPWFDKANLVAQLEASSDAEESRRLTIDAAKNLLRLQKVQVDEARQAGRIPILASHALVMGSETSTGQVLIGTTVELPPHDLFEVGAAYTALGHIHKTQHWFDGRVAYAGSPIRQNFGESEPKGFRLVEVERDGEEYNFRHAFIELPARAIELLEVDLTGATTDAIDRLHQYGSERDVRGALVRLRYRIDSQNLHLIDEEKLEKIIRADGAHDVKIEAVVVPQTRVRSEIVSAITTFDKIQAYWQAKGISVDDATRDRIREKLSKIESPASVYSSAAD